MARLTSCLVVLAATVALVAQAQDLRDVDGATCDGVVLVGDGSDYRGTLSTTVSGLTCQNWASQTPHSHTRTPERFAEQGIGNHNFCRNPDGELAPWCFTTNPNVPWEYCDVCADDSVTSSQPVTSPTTTTQAPTTTTPPPPPPTTTTATTTAPTTTAPPTTTTTTSSSTPGEGLVSLSLSPVADTTIYSESSALANGAGSEILAGVTARGFARRSLVRFDFSSIQQEGEIVDAKLELYTTKAASTAPQTLSLRRITQNWGEGASNAGLDDGGQGDGAAATTNSATWQYTFYPTSFWANLGGDFSNTVSSSATSGSVNSYLVFEDLGADVADMRSQPLENFGWILANDDEDTSRSALVFGSSENEDEAVRPRLVVVIRPTEDTTAGETSTSSATTTTAAADTTRPDTTQSDTTTTEADATTTTTTTQGGGVIVLPGGAVCRNGELEGTGNNYRGDLSMTVGGLTCQEWTSQEPHAHSRTPENYPNGGLGEHNFCRNPDGDVRPWCFTTDPTVQWQYCDVCSDIDTTTTTAAADTTRPDTTTTTATTTTEADATTTTTEADTTTTTTTQGGGVIVLPGGAVCRNGELEGTGNNYRGDLSMTVGGLTCQEWTSQEPHGHSRTPENYPNGGLGEHNFCRNPDGDVRPWCFTTDPTVQWQYCDVCSDIDITTTTAADTTRPDTTQPDTSTTTTEADTTTTTTTTQGGGVIVLPGGAVCRNGELEGTGNNYRGDLSMTVGGLTCQEWTSQEPHGHSRTPENYPNGGLGEHNFCRNPDGDVRPWCFTTDPEVQWQYCDVCSDLPDTTTTTTQSQADTTTATTQAPTTSTAAQDTTTTAADTTSATMSETQGPTTTTNDVCVDGQLVGDGAEYRGTVGTTVSGRACQPWTSQSPHRHSRTPSNYPGAGLEDGPFCRNPDGDVRPWCFTTDPQRQWEYCDVCAAAETTTTPAADTTTTPAADTTTTPAADTTTTPAADTTTTAAADTTTTTTTTTTTRAPCVDRENGCQVCRDENTCEFCRDKKYQLGGQCLDECPPGFNAVGNPRSDFYYYCDPIPDTPPAVCTDRENGCQVCRDDNTCEFCRDKQYLLGGVCLDACPPGYHEVGNPRSDFYYFCDVIPGFFTTTAAAETTTTAAAETTTTPAADTTTTPAADTTTTAAADTTTTPAADTTTTAAADTTTTTPSTDDGSGDDTSTVDPCNCDDTEDVVCGDNGVEYPNACFAACDGVDFVPGNCPVETTIAPTTCALRDPVVIDSEDVTSANATVNILFGEWTRETDKSNFFQGASYWKYTNGDEPGQIIFNIVLPEAGDYLVSLSYFASPNNTEAGSVVIISEAADELQNSFTVNQQIEPLLNGFEPVAVLPFLTEGNQLVAINSADADGDVIVDAIKFDYLC